VLYLFL